MIVPVRAQRKVEVEKGQRDIYSWNEIITNSVPTLKMKHFIELLKSRKED